MDPSGEIEPVVLVPEPIPSAIHSMDAESEKEEMIDDIPHIPGDEVKLKSNARQFDKFLVLFHTKR